MQEAQAQMPEAWQEQRARRRWRHSSTKPCLAALLVPSPRLLPAPSEPSDLQPLLGHTLGQTLCRFSQPLGSCE